MQGKGIVKFFLVVMILVTLYQFLLILPARKVEKAAEAYAEQVAERVSDPEQKTEVYKAARTAYLDSMSSEVVFRIPLIKDFTYQELKGQQLALGLDLKGGMSVVLQVDLRDFILALANNSDDPDFRKALDLASEKLKNSQSDFVTLFGQAWKEVAPDKPLNSIFRRNESLADQINANTPDDEVLRVLRQKADETVELTYKLLKERIDKLGVTQPNVSLDKARDLIVVELPGVDNPERARQFLQAAAKLEFWNVYRITDPGIVDAFVRANEKLRRMEAGQESEADTARSFELRYTYGTDSLGNVDSSVVLSVDTIFTGEAASANQGPLFDIFQLNADGARGLAVMGTARKNQRARVLELLHKPGVRELFPKDVKFLWSRKPIKDPKTGELTDLYELYAIKMERGTTHAPLEGDHVTNAIATPDPNTGEMKVSLSMDDAGARKWGQMTTKAAQDNNREIAIVLDDEVVSAPRVINPILSGDSEITGNFTTQEAKDLANILQVGKLPARTQIIQEAIVGPSLGAENISRSLKALIAGFLIVVLFMVAYYGGAGLVSIVALIANVFFILGALASYGTVLTLPGIAGIILTIGMAVDANVIIYERVREELRAGKTLALAIADGFRYSYSAIIDANVTTILTAIILAYFGLGPIKGFAVVLIIGVLSSLFTAVLLTRLLIDWWVGKGNNLTFWTGWSKDMFANLNFDWVGKRRLAYAVSGTLIVAGLISMFTRGFDFGVDFKGGYSFNVEFAGDAPSADELRTTLDAAFEGHTPVVKAVDTRNTFNIVTDYLVDSDDDDAQNQVIAKLYEGLQQLGAVNTSLENFSHADAVGVTHITSFSKVGPTIADDIKNSAWEATIFALLVIFLYIFLRFSKWQYSLGAVAALFHDVLITLGMFSLLHGIVPWTLEIDQAFVAAILTVVGYSINDTVVVFDRIREFFSLYSDKSKDEIINDAINNTFSRTIITSLTTLFVVALLFFFGGTSIKGFAFALMIGIIVGTYSSIFIATPVMSDLSGDIRVGAKKQKSSFSKAAARAR